MFFYNLLLHLCPASFRAEYGEEMSRILEGQLQQVPLPARLWLWLEALADLCLTALHVHADILWQDISFAIRDLQRRPGFAITVVLVAALGIGATTAVFSLTDHVLVRPLPFADAGRLVNLWEDQSRHGYSYLEPSPANYRDWQHASASFEVIGAHRGLSVNVVDANGPDRWEGAALTASVLPMLGVRPILGRVFTPAEDQPNAAGTVVLSYSMWQQRYGGEIGVIGRKLVLDGEPYTVIGVMPPSFHFPQRDAQVWMPMRFREDDFADRNNNYLHVAAKLRAGVSLKQARAEMGVIANQLERQYPKENAGVGVQLRLMRDVLSPRARLLFMTLLAASLCVLLIACTNLANLLLARALARRKELAVRTALGAGTERLVRQMLTESFLLSCGGGLLGVGLAIAALPLLVRLVPNSLPIAEIPSVDWRVLTIALSATVITAIGAGLLPAIRACRDTVHAGLREGARSGVGGRKERLRATLVIAEVTAAVALVIVSGLLVRALWRIHQIDPGFQAAGVLTLRTSLPMPQYESMTRRAAFYRRVLDGIQRLPGVKGAAYTSFLPMTLHGGVQPFALPGESLEESKRHAAPLRFVTPGYFSTLQIPLLRGRDFRESDGRDALWVALVSDSFVKNYSPNRDPIGMRFRFAGADRTVVGVVGDVKFRGPETPTEPQVYLPYQQVQDGAVIWYAPKDLAIRVEGETDPLLPSIRQIIAQADPQQPVSDVRSLSDIVEGETASRQMQLRVLGAFACVAILLAAIGIHGLLSFGVSQRVQEIGVRLALGAQRRQILQIVLGESFRLTVVGIALGTALAYAAGQSLEALLAGIAPADYAVFSASVLIALVMTLAGSLFPALRAARVDAMTALRAE